MQDGGANTNANSNGPKWQHMNIYYNHVLCVVSVLLFLFLLRLVFAPNSCVSVLLLLLLLMLLLFLMQLCSHIAYNMGANSPYTQESIKGSMGANSPTIEDGMDTVLFVCLDPKVRL